VVEEVGMDALLQLCIGLPRRLASKGQDTLHIWSEQALAQHTLSDHTGRAEDHYFHGYVPLSSASQSGWQPEFTMRRLCCELERAFQVASLCQPSLSNCTASGLWR